MSSGTGEPGPVAAQSTRRRGRPYGELQQAIARAAAAAPGTARDLATRAQVGYGAARYTVARMVARGELVELGRQLRDGSTRPAGVFGPPPADRPASPPADGAGLALLLSAWRGAA